MQHTSVVHQSARTHVVCFVLHHHHHQREVTLIHAALELQPPTEASAVFRSWYNLQSWMEACRAQRHLEQVTLLRAFSLHTTAASHFNRIAQEHK